MLENTNIKQFYPGPILNKTLDITDFLFKDPEQVHITYTYKNEDGSLSNRELTYGTEYEVAKILPSDVTQVDAVLTASTGRVTLKANLNVALGERLTIYRESEIVQETQYPRTGPFPAASHEGALDYLTMQNQEQQDQIDRSLKVPISTANFDGALPIPVPARALKINNSGSGFELSEYDPDTALETTKEYMEGAQTAASNALASQNAAASSASSAANSEIVATQQANIATAKTVEVTETYNNAMADITTNKEQSMSAINENRISSIEEISNTKITAISDITTAGTEQVANIKQTGFYMQDNKLYYIDSKGETKEFKTSSGLEICDIGMALYVDEKKWLRRYLNGQILDRNKKTEAFFTRLKELTTLHPSLLCTEEEWQTAKTMSAFGQVGKFVFNYSGDEIVSVRLPRVVNVQGLFDLQNLGMTVQAGLPEHRHIMFQHNGNNTNITETSFVGSSRDTGGYAGYEMGQKTNDEEPSLGKSGLVIESNIYGKSNTVQQEAVQYPYFIQIATGSETKNNIINEIELNNPFSLFDSKYSDHELNNLSWLKSEGQWNAKAVYPTAYDELLKEYNNPDRLAIFNKDAFTVVGSPNITDDGVASLFSASDYLEAQSNVITYNNFRIDLEFDVNPASVTSTQNIFGFSFNNYARAELYTNGTINFVWTPTNGGVKECSVTFDSIGTHYEYSTGYDGTNFFLEVECDGAKKTYKVAGMMSSALGKVCIGRGYRRESVPFTAGSIDLKKFSITVDGVKVFSGAKSKVKLSTETYTDYDFVLNTADETFRLPLLDGSEDLPSDRYDDLELKSSGSIYTAPANGIVSFNKVAGAADKYANIYVRFSDQSNSYSTGAIGTSSGQNLMINAFVKKGANYVVNYNATGKTNFFKFIYAQGNGSLYFYVGETVQNANLIDAGRIGEQLADKIGRTECKAYITETYVNGTSGYRLYSDKWCEQWGYKSGVNGETITFLKAFKDTNYNVVMATENASVYFQGNYRNKTTTSMRIEYTGGQGGTATGTSWMVTGYIA